MTVPSQSTTKPPSLSPPPTTTPSLSSTNYFQNIPLASICNRALSDPISISPIERSLILCRPDPSIEDSLYITRTSLSLSALINKALGTPQNLTRAEAHALVWGPEDISPEEQNARDESQDKLSVEERDLLRRACAAVADPEEKKAHNVAWGVLQAYKAEERRVERERRKHADQTQADDGAGIGKAVVFRHERSDWISMLRFKGFRTWGLPVLRTDYSSFSGWADFRERFSRIAAREMQMIAPDLFPTLSIQYIEDEQALAGADHPKLLAYYAQALQDGKIAEGCRWGVFISADENVLERFSEDNMEDVVPVWYADWKAGDVGEAGFSGALAMTPEMIWRILMQKLVRKDIMPLEGLAMMASER